MSVVDSATTPLLISLKIELDVSTGILMIKHIAKSQLNIIWDRTTGQIQKYISKKLKSLFSYNAFNQVSKTYQSTNA